MIKKIILITTLLITSISITQANPATRNFQAQSLFELLYVIDVAFNMQTSYWTSGIEEERFSPRRTRQNHYRIGNITLDMTDKDQAFMPTEANIRKVLPEIHQLMERNRRVLNIQYKNNALRIDTDVNNCYLFYQIRQNTEGKLVLNNRSNYTSCSDFPTEERWEAIYDAIPYQVFN